MQHLPSEEEQDELLKDLAGLIATRGAATFLTAPIVEPHPRFLPDEWTADFEGVRRLLARLMLYAGLDLHADLSVFDPGASEAGADRPLASVTGNERGRWQFALDGELIADPQFLIAALCQIVAEAYRQRHGLRHADVERELELIDLTQIFLGFGIFATNAADSFRRTVELRGHHQITRHRFRRFGALSPLDMTFLLAVQVVARGWPAARIKTLARFLEDNQAEFLSDAVEELTPRRAEILDRLGLLPEIAVEAEPDLERLTRPLGGSFDVVLTVESGSLERFLSEPGPPKDPAADHTVYALREGTGRYALLAVFGSLAGLLLSMLVAIPAVQPGYFVVAGALVYLLFLGGPRRYTCTDVACRKRIGPNAQVCPGCGGRIARRIRSKAEIYADEE